MADPVQTVLRAMWEDPDYLKHLAETLKLRACAEAVDCD